MTQGHKEGQALFEALGRKFGFDVARSFTKTLPTDGLWYSGKGAGRFTGVPIAAIEIVVSESRKTIRGSVLTLELVSPGLGILVVHEDAIRRRLVRAGLDIGEATARVKCLRDHAQDVTSASRQRIEVWSYADLVREYRRATGAASLWRIRSQGNAVLDQTAA